MRLKGITIKLISKEKTGKDGFGHATYEDVEYLIEDVLVAPENTSEVSVETNVNASKTIYNLAIPKGDSHNWKNADVEFFGKRWHVIGLPIEGIEEMIPLRWNKKVTVELYE